MVYICSFCGASENQEFLSKNRKYWIVICRKCGKRVGIRPTPRATLEGMIKEA